MHRLAIGGLLIGLGCSSSLDGQPAGDQLPVASDYCETIAPFFCDFYLRCGRMAVDTHEQCLSVFAESCEVGFEPYYVQLEQRGLLQLSSTGLSACESHLDAVSCEQQVWELRGPCASMWEGQQAQGQPCGLDFDNFICAAGTTCKLGPGLCGTCETFVAVGSPCDTDIDCAADAFCDNVCTQRTAFGDGCAPTDRCEVGGACLAGVCVGPDFVDVGDPCDFDNRCPYLSECRSGSCVGTARLDEPCNATTLCEKGYCDGVCKPWGTQGASCNDDGQCLAGECDDSACGALPTGCVP